MIPSVYDITGTCTHACMHMHEWLGNGGGTVRMIPQKLTCTRMYTGMIQQARLDWTGLNYTKRAWAAILTIREIETDSLPPASKLITSSSLA